MATDIKIKTLHFERASEIEEELEKLNITSDKLIDIKIMPFKLQYFKADFIAYIIYRVKNEVD